MKKIFIGAFLLAIVYWLTKASQTEQNDSPDDDDSGTNDFGVDDSCEDDASTDESDADDYYGNLGKVVSVINAKDSANVLTEKKALDEFRNRGFFISPTSDYTIDGDEISTKVDSLEPANAKHPDYMTFYYSTNSGIDWAIVSINGQFMATPAVYDKNGKVAENVVFSEKPEFTSYDSVTDRFFVICPDADKISLLVIDRIDTQTLDELDVYAMLEKTIS